MTDWQERREFEERLAQGQGITVVEAQQLVHDVDDAERYEALYEGLRKALKDTYGIVAVDTTTDDDEEVRITLVDANPEWVDLESAIKREGAIVPAGERKFDPNEEEYNEKRFTEWWEDEAGMAERAAHGNDLDQFLSYHRNDPAPRT